MSDRPDQCQAIRDRTGDYVCNRCGLYWDAGDEAPECRLKQEKEINNREFGRSILAKLKEDLSK